MHTTTELTRAGTKARWFCQFSGFVNDGHMTCPGLCSSVKHGAGRFLDKMPLQSTGKEHTFSSFSLHPYLADVPSLMTSDALMIYEIELRFLAHGFTVKGKHLEPSLGRESQACD